MSSRRDAADHAGVYRENDSQRMSAAGRTTVHCLAARVNPGQPVDFGEYPAGVGQIGEDRVSATVL